MTFVPAFRIAIQILLTLILITYGTNNNNQQERQTLS